MMKFEICGNSYFFYDSNKKVNLVYTLKNGIGRNYYLNNERGDNYEIFKIAGIEYDNKYDFQKRILGYHLNGVFPECKSIKDINKLCRELVNTYNNVYYPKNTSIKIHRHKIQLRYGI